MKRCIIQPNQFSLYFQSKIYAFAINPLTNKLLGATAERLCLFDLENNSHISELNYSEIFLNYFECYGYQKVQVNSIRHCLMFNHWVILVNNKTFLFLNDTLQYSVPINLEYPIYDMCYHQINEEIICIRDDRKQFKVFKIEVVNEKIETNDQNRFDSLSIYDAPKQAEKNGHLSKFLCSFEMDLSSNKSPAQLKSTILQYYLSEVINIMVCNLENKDIVLVSTTKYNLIATIQMKDFFTQHPIISICQELLFVCDSQSFLVYDMVLEKEIKKEKLPQNINTPIHMMAEYLSTSGYILIVTMNYKVYLYNFRSGGVFEEEHETIEIFEDSKKLENENFIVQPLKKGKSMKNYSKLNLFFTNFKIESDHYTDHLGQRQHYMLSDGTLKKIKIGSPIVSKIQTEVYDIAKNQMDSFYSSGSDSYKTRKLGATECVMISLDKKSILVYDIKANEIKDDTVISFNSLWNNSSDLALPTASTLLSNKSSKIIGFSQSAVMIMQNNIFIMHYDRTIIAMFCQLKLRIIYELNDYNSFEKLYIVNDPPETQKCRLICMKKGIIAVFQMIPLTGQIERLKAIPYDGMILDIKYSDKNNIFFMAGTDGQIFLFKKDLTYINSCSFLWESITSAVFINDNDVICGFSIGHIQVLQICVNKFLFNKSTVYKWHEAAITHILHSDKEENYFVSACQGNFICLWNMNNSDAPLKVFTFLNEIKAIYFWRDYHSKEEFKINIINTENLITTLDYRAGVSFNKSKLQKNIEHIQNHLLSRSKYMAKIIREKKSHLFTRNDNYHEILSKLIKIRESLFANTEKYQNYVNTAITGNNLYSQENILLLDLEKLIDLEPANIKVIYDIGLRMLLQNSKYEIDQRHIKQIDKTKYKSNFKNLMKNFDEKKQDEKKKLLMKEMLDYLKEKYKGPREFQKEVEFLFNFFDMSCINLRLFEYLRTLDYKVQLYQQQRKKEAKEKKPHPVQTAFQDSNELKKSTIVFSNKNSVAALNSKTSIKEPKAENDELINLHKSKLKSHYSSISAALEMAYDKPLFFIHKSKDKTFFWRGLDKKSQASESNRSSALYSKDSKPTASTADQLEINGLQAYTLQNKGDFYQKQFYPKLDKHFSSFHSNLMHPDHFHQTTKSMVHQIDYVAMHSKGFSNKDNLDFEAHRHRLQNFVKLHYYSSQFPSYDFTDEAKVKSKIKKFELIGDFLPQKNKELIIDESITEFESIRKIWKLLKDAQNIVKIPKQTGTSLLGYDSPEKFEQLKLENNYIHDILSKIKENNLTRITQEEALKLRDIVKRRLQNLKATKQMLLLQTHEEFINIEKNESEVKIPESFTTISPERNSSKKSSFVQKFNEKIAFTDNFKRKEDLSQQKKSKKLSPISSTANKNSLKKVSQLDLFQKIKSKLQDRSMPEIDEDKVVAQQKRQKIIDKLKKFNPIIYNSTTNLLAKAISEVEIKLNTKLKDDLLSNHSQNPKMQDIFTASPDKPSSFVMPDDFTNQDFKKYYIPIPIQENSPPHSPGKKSEHNVSADNSADKIANKNSPNIKSQKIFKITGFKGYTSETATKMVEDINPAIKSSQGFLSDFTSKFDLFKNSGIASPSNAEKPENSSKNKMQNIDSFRHTSPSVVMGGDNFIVQFTSVADLKIVSGKQETGDPIEDAHQEKKSTRKKKTKKKKINLF